MKNFKTFQKFYERPTFPRIKMEKHLGWINTLLSLGIYIFKRWKSIWVGISHKLMWVNQFLNQLT